jgi:AAA domain
MQPRVIVGPGGTPFTVLGDDAPHLNGKNGRNGKADNAPAVSIMPATAYAPEPVRWVWPGWLALGKFHLLAGAPGTGKTTIAVSIAATVSAGARWPDGTAAEHGDVLIWSAEDGVSDTLLPRLLVAGGHPGRVHFVDGITEHGKARPFDPSTDMPALVRAARQLPNLKLIVLDPVVAAVSGDSHNNTETRRGLQQLADDAGKEILEKMIDAAKGGDMRAADLVLSRIWPVRKGRPITLELPPIGTAADIVSALGKVADAVAAGDVTPDEASAMANVLEMKRRTIETVELESRISALEKERSK